jgi:hypothetical protein
VRKLTTVIAGFRECIEHSRILAADAHEWSIPAGGNLRPLIKLKRRDEIVELAFFRALNGWEAFLEESFVLYMLGHQPPRGRKLRRYGFPPTENAAHEWITDNRPYANWTHHDVIKRADRFFHSGRPFTGVLERQLNLFNQTKILRNALAHESRSAQQKFEGLVRELLGAFPPNLTVGGFLMTAKPRSVPPVLFLHYYLDEIENAAMSIIPT